MTGKTALVTGGAQRLGKQLVLALAEDGFDIAIHYNTSADDAQALCQEVSKLGRKALAYDCNLADFSAAKTHPVESLVKRVCTDFANLVLVVNNASMFEAKSFQDTSLDFLERNFNVHCKAPFVLTQEFARLCKQGQIVNITDAAVVKSSSHYFAYLLSKKALQEFTSMAAAELGPAIRVNAIAPGPILPPVDISVDDPASYMAKRAEKQILKTAGDPKYVTSALRYLIANEYVTGQCLFVDGGEHLK